MARLVRVPRSFGFRTAASKPSIPLGQTSGVAQLSRGSTWLKSAKSMNDAAAHRSEAEHSSSVRPRSSISLLFFFFLFFDRGHALIMNNDDHHTSIYL